MPTVPSSKGGSLPSASTDTATATPGTPEARQMLVEARSITQMREVARRMRERGWAQPNFHTERCTYPPPNFNPPPLPAPYLPEGLLAAGDC